MKKYVKSDRDIPRWLNMSDIELRRYINNRIEDLLTDLGDSNPDASTILDIIGAIVGGLESDFRKYRMR